MITCIAIDDEPLALKQMTSYINKTPYLDLQGGFSNALKALEYLQNSKVDLMFVDINMPDLSGIDFVKSLSNPPKVIFTTAYREYAVEGFQVDAADYLVKPISYPDFIQSVEKTTARYFTPNEASKTSQLSKAEQASQITQVSQSDQPDQPSQEIQVDEEFMFVKSEYRLVRINLHDIKYIESMRDYVRIHLDNQKPIMTLISLNKIWNALSKSQFIRVHRSYVVNSSKITTIERNRIIFDSNIYIPISEQYKADFQLFIDEHILK